MIASARRLKMAVRGWVAEEKLRDVLSLTEGVTDCERLDEEGGADLRLRWKGGPPLLIECKNVLRKTNAAGLAKIDFQRTRASKSDPCSRYYSPTDFDVVAGCLHAISENWEFRYVVPDFLTHGLAARVSSTIACLSMNGGRRMPEVRSMGPPRV
ncbi:hypothetical protein [Jiella pelagia]|uniref:Restriction endonuclease n=1 Tax=Jiella pelagia TaxID=2986949 RepID=A0ABY7C201_9HYPH|nr:hypothetical protein [Jiella pelagia]WAP70038.1 hypothetical protein OH818_07780 [Jiella pelagia]